jgi:TonB family protein
MKINEKGVNRLAFVFTLVFHIILLAIHIPYPKEKIKATVTKYRIPIQMKISKAPIRKKSNSKKIAVPKPKKKKVATKRKAEKVVTAKKIEQPTSLPGDRDIPVVTDDSFIPVYPKEALNNNWEGKVELLVLINEKGIAANVEVIKSSGHKVLDESFKRTVQNYYKYKPKRVMGKNVMGKIRIEYEF